MTLLCLQELLYPIPLQVIALVNAEVIHLLYATHKALTAAAKQLEAAEREQAIPNGRVGRPERAKTPLAVNRDVVAKEAKAEREKSLSRAALKVLSDQNAASEPLPVEGQSSAKDEIASKIPFPTVEPPKLTKFLICVSEESGFPRSLRFEPGVFDGAALFQHDEDEHEGEKAALHIADDDRTHFVGGTIHLKGPEREFNRVEKILTLIVCGHPISLCSCLLTLLQIFAVCHLKIEMHLLRDHLCSRPAPPAVPPKSPDLQTSSDSTPVIEDVPALPAKDSPTLDSEGPLSPLSPISPDSESTMTGHVRKWSKGGFVNFLLGRQAKEAPDQSNKLKKRFSTKLKMHRTRSISRRSGELGRLAPFSPKLPSFRLPGALPGALPYYDDWEMVAPDTSVVVEQAKHEEQAAGEALTAPATPTASVVRGSLDVLPAVPPNPNERFLRVIERMEKAILSVSPGVHYPPPALLLELRDEEKSVQHNELARVPGRPLLGRVRSFQDTLPKGAMSPLSTASPSTDGLPTSSSATALSSAALSPPVSQRRINIDTRTGLGSLMTGNNSLVCFVIKQSKNYS